MGLTKSMRLSFHVIFQKMISNDYFLKIILNLFPPTFEKRRKWVGVGETDGKGSGDGGIEFRGWNMPFYKRKST
jgi:hypothetical protein